ncbi:PLDc N-terminal domain-containing protein [Streptomyces sp. NBC_01450]|uniref:PLDc N-terminal domain-containing protein n=1 Tax=Streptomyces sp. NBC_01450 TaxID=2903871 RepID=UPI002E2F9E0F|nr:PLDc N-terminal domain-containing protein [Streptomyces sp. NBC_01450]
MTSLLVYAIYLIVAALYVYALVDCLRTPPARIRMLPKVSWLVILVLCPVLGAIGWRNLRKRSAHAGQQPSAA